MREAFRSTVLLLLPVTHSPALAGARTRRETRGVWLSGGRLGPQRPSTSMSSYLLGLPVEGMKGASFFCFGFTWRIPALPVLSEDV